VVAAVLEADIPAVVAAVLEAEAITPHL